jgi:hypothetical protein
MRTVADKSLPFRYQGEAIRRSANDVVLMDSGSITSSLTEDPYYHIEARRIWVLRPGEWGLQNAVLYLGRFPVFWFPFYFQPGDDPVFRPYVGVLDVTGAASVHVPRALDGSGCETGPFSVVAGHRYLIGVVDLDDAYYSPDVVTGGHVRLDVSAGLHCHQQIRERFRMCVDSGRMMKCTCEGLF